MNDIDDALRFAVLSVILVARSAVVPAFFLDMVPQVPFLNKALEVGLEGFAVLGSVPILLVVRTKFALVPGGPTTSHWLRPLEEGLCFDLAEELVDRLLEDRVHSFVGGSFASEFSASPRGRRGPVTI